MPSRSVRLALLAALAVWAATWGLLAAGSLRAEDAWPEPPEAKVEYAIDAELTRVADDDGNDDHFRIVGSTRITWRNPSDEPVPVLYLHLYANAFRNADSSLLSERARNGDPPPEDARYGGIEVTSALFSAGEALTLEYVQPDDGNTADRTVARIALPRPVEPGGKAVVTLRFVTTLPSVIRRMGHHEGFVMAAQWYPKLGRYVGTSSRIPHVRDGWYCHQYHESTEFVADHGDYTVNLTLPRDMKLGATGVPAADAELDQEKGTRRFSYKARSVVDFAWAAHARFERIEKLIQPIDPSRPREPVARERKRLARLLELPVEAFDLPPVKVVLLLQPEHADQAERHFDAARLALGMFGVWFGPYPYEQLTIVDPAFGAGAAGGMEYPTLVTAGTSIGRTPQSLDPEHVVIHEIGHQWFMNLLASNEAEEAWLDEGINSYFTGYFMDLAYGSAVHSTRLHGRPVTATLFYEFPGVTQAWPAALELPDWATPPDMPLFTAWVDLPWICGVPELAYHGDFALAWRPRWVRKAGLDAGVQAGFDYHDRGSYAANAYSRGALFIHALRRSLQAELGKEPGERAFARAFRTYARNERWSYPTTDDLLGCFAETTGKDPAPLADALLRTTGVLDYGVESLRTVDAPGAAPDTAPEDDDEPAPGKQRTEVVVRRYGEVVRPVVLAVTRDEQPAGEDAVWERIDWDGVATWKRFTVDGVVTAARVDPDGIYDIDVNRSNDSRTRRASHRPSAKWSMRLLLWLENACLSYGRFF